MSTGTAEVRGDRSLPHCPWGRKGRSWCGKQAGRSPSTGATSLLGNTAKHIRPRKNVYPNVTVSFLTRAQRQKWPKCPATNGQMGRLWSVSPVVQCSAVNGSELLVCATTCLNLENTVHARTPVSEAHTLHDSIPIRVQKRDIDRHRKCIGDCLGLGVAGRTRRWVTASFREEENGLKRTVMMVLSIGKYTQNHSTVWMQNLSQESGF